MWASKERLLCVLFFMVYGTPQVYRLVFWRFQLFSSLFLGGFLILLLYFLNPYLIYYIVVSHKKEKRI